MGKDGLAKDDVAVSLEELELKMRHHEQTVYVLSEYIDTKGAETMFEPIAEECHNVMAQINAETIRVLAEQPVFMAGNPYLASLSKAVQRIVFMSETDLF